MPGGARMQSISIDSSLFSFHHHISKKIEKIIRKSLSPSDNSNKDDNNRNDQEEVNNSSDEMKSSSDKPKDYKYDCDSGKHRGENL